jgi:hypothetical protein
LDYANYGLSLYHKPSLFVFDLNDDSNTLKKKYIFPSHVAGMGSYLNDFQIDNNSRFMYIIDTSLIGTTPALIVYDMKHDKSYRVIDSHHSLYGSSYFLDFGNTRIKFGPFGFKINIDSVVLSRDNNYLFYGALTGTDFWRVKTSFLHEFIEEHSIHTTFPLSKTLNHNQVDQSKFEEKFELLTNRKPLSDGATSDDHNNIYLTSIMDASIAVGRFSSSSSSSSSSQQPKDPPTFKFTKLIQNASILPWPDGFSFGPGGLYIAASAVYHKFSSQHVRHYGPFYISRISTDKLKVALGDDFKAPKNGQ